MKKIFTLLVIVICFLQSTQGQTTGDFRSNAAGPANWNDFNAWQIYNGSTWVPAISGQLPTATSAVTIQSGHTININALALTSGNLLVNGTLVYNSTTVSALTVSGIVTVSGTGSFTSPTSGIVTTHTLSISNDLDVNGTFNMNVFSTAAVAVTFTGAANDSIWGAGSINFYSLTVNKGTTITPILEVSRLTPITITIPAATVNTMPVVNGTLKISSASTLSTYYNYTPGTPVCTATGRLWLNNAAAVVQSVNAGTATGGAGGVLISGTLQVDAGTFSVGSGADLSLMNGTLILISANATVNFYGGVAFGPASILTMTNGNINIDPQRANSLYSMSHVLEFQSTSAIAVNATGGNITIVNPNAGNYNGFPQILVSGAGTYNFAGSTFLFGDGVSTKPGAAGFGFSISTGNVALGNVVVNNPPAATNRMVRLYGTTSFGGNLTINSGAGNIFQLDGWYSYMQGGFTLNLGGSLINNGTFTGSYAGSTLIFNGSGLQTVSGTGTFSIIHLVSVNNSSVLNPAIDLQVPLTITDNLTLTSGALGSTNSSVLTLGNSATSATMAINRSGGSLPLTPSFAPSGVTFNVTYNAPVPAANITTGNEIPSVVNGTLKINNYNVVSAISGVTLSKAVSCAILDLTAGNLTTTSSNSITITGTTLASLLNGSATSYVNGPFTRTLPAGLAGSSNNYKFPIGKNSYHLFEYENITTSGTGNATFTAEVFDAGPYSGTAGYGMSTINTDKLYKLSGNLGSVTITFSKIRITDPTLISTNKIAQSNNATGTYGSVGGILETGAMATTKSIDYTNLSAGTYFRIGTIGTGIPAGLYAIGPNGPYSGYLATYTTLQAAANDVSDLLLAGNFIFEFQPDYSSAIEGYPVVLPQTIVGSLTGTVTFRPAASVSSIINFTNAGNVISMNGCDFVIFDGRNGGIGTNKFLQFTNTSSTSQTMDLSNDATNDQLLYCIFKGSSTSTSTGTLMFLPGVTLGNSNNLVDHCNFNGSGVASNGIYATGSAAAINNAVAVSNNNFFDYRAAGLNAGMFVGGNNLAWIIDANSFYQTIAYNATAGTSYGMYIPSGGDNFQISNNNIGGSGPALAGIWTISTTTPVVCSFYGIYASLGTTVASRIYNNKVQNFSWVTNSGSAWNGIWVGGLVDVGTGGANYIGNNTTTGNILITCYNAGSISLSGIASTAITGSYLENNIVGSLTTAANGAVVVSSTIYPIKNTGSQIVRNNIVGSTTIPLSVSASTTGGTNIVSGIYSSGPLPTITGNTIANLYSASSIASIRGIDNGNSGSVITFSTNTIFNLSTVGLNTGTGASASVIGIYDGASGTSGVNTISANTIYNLANTGVGAVSVYGIYYGSGDGGTSNSIEKNLIHSFNTISNTAIQMGIVLGSGTTVIKNNVIRLGVDINGNSITSTAQITGMSIAPSTGCCVPPKIEDVYFNTVYVGGTGVVGGTVKSYAFILQNHGNYSGTGLGEDIRDNIFTNVRANAVANLLNYAISLPAPMAGVPSIWDYNIYNVSSTNGKLGVVGGVDIPFIGTLQEVYPGNDLHSGFGNPLLTNLAAAMATMSLIPANLSPAEGNGIAIALVTDDFAGLLRSSYTPTDIGAYAGNYTPAGPGQDIFWPIISFNKLFNTSITTGRQTYNFATITDVVSGVNTTTGTKPRIYYKKFHDANAFAGNTNANNGWKWVESTSTASPFDFLMDYSLLQSPVIMGDTIQYFVVAQDLATIPNVSFKPSTGAVGTSVATTGMTAPTTPYSYKIVPLLPSTLNVGTGYTYLTLTGTGGLFDAINNGVISSSAVATIKTDITEPGTVSLNLVNEQGPGAGTYTFTIQSDGTPHLLTGAVTTANAPMIPITGAMRFFIDGGPTKLLTLRNASTGGPVVQYNNTSQADTLKNCFIESNSNSTTIGEVTIGSTGINKIGITTCDFRDSRGGTLGSPNICVYSNSNNNTLTIINNNIYNFKNATTYITAYGLYLPNVANGCTISGNSFFIENAINPVCPITCIYFQNTNSHLVTGNFIGGTAPLCSGTPLTLSNPITFTGIYTYFAIAPNIIIQGNTIQNINMTSTGAPIFYGINNYEGPVTVTGNTVGSATLANTIQIAGGSFVGIYNSYSYALFASTFEKNTVANITMTNMSGSPSLTGMKMEGGTVRQNKIFALGGSVAAATPVITGISNTSGLGTNEFSNNMIALNGGTSTNPTLYGFNESSTVAGTTNFYYNSINLYGTASGAASTYAFYRTGTASYILNNNILSNLRTGGTGKHYAILSTPVTGFTSDYNDLYVAGAILGSWGGTDKANLTAWKAIVVAPLLDQNTLSTLPAFTSNSNLYIITDPNLANKGTPVSVTVDIDGVVRCNPPDIGINKFGNCTVNLNLTVFLEGLYAGAGMMNAALDNTFLPKWGPTIADHVTVELHSTTTYATIIYTANDVPLNTNGTLTVAIPGIYYNGSYYITIKHRNSLETVIATPVLFNASAITYNMSNLATKAFGGNMKAMSGGVFAIYAGDVSSLSGIYPAAPVKDGVIDLFDDFYVYSSFLNGDFGYLPGDVNGDGVVDLFDAYIVYTNYLLGIYAITP